MLTEGGEVFIQLQDPCDGKLRHRNAVYAAGVIQGDAVRADIVERHAVKPRRGQLDTAQLFERRNVVIEEKAVADNGVHLGKIAGGRTPFILLKIQGKTVLAQHITLLR